jgi:hypothetical protein
MHAFGGSAGPTAQFDMRCSGCVGERVRRMRRLAARAAVRIRQPGQATCLLISVARQVGGEPVHGTRRGKRVTTTHPKCLLGRRLQECRIPTQPIALQNIHKCFNMCAFRHVTWLTIGDA